MIVFGWTHKLPEGSLYSISHRTFYTQVQKVLPHRIILMQKDHDDLPLQSLPYDFPHKPLVHVVILQYDGVVEEM